MKVTELAQALDAKVLTGSEAALQKDVTGAYAGDLLSWVMSRAGVGSVWLTIMSNLNVAAVAVMADVACVLLAESVQPDEALVSRAVREDVALLAAPFSVYEGCWRVHACLEGVGAL